jgi:hypothetical protein
VVEQAGPGVRGLAAGDEVAWRDYLKVAAVESGDHVEVQSLGERYHARVHDLEPQRGVGGEQFGHPPVVMWRDLDDTELVVGAGGAEFGGQASASVPLRISQQMTDQSLSPRAWRCR